MLFQYWSRAVGGEANTETTLYIADQGTFSRTAGQSQVYYNT